MRAEVTTLGNGLRVASFAMPGLATVSLGVWVATGARHERDAEHGLSHLLEHMAFKGTKRRSAKQIAEDIEQVGGELNAVTSLEYTAYYARVLAADTPLALDILADILSQSTFDAVELAREREVIVQEIAASLDSPDDIVYDLVHATAFPGQPLGRNILGTPESVSAIGAGDLRGFLKRNYGAKQMVLAAAGAVDHEALCRHAEAQFGGLAEGELGEERQACYVGGVAASDKPFEQAHVVMGFEGPSYLDETHYAAQVFSGLFGGGMSSRLFQEVREKRGLAYAIYSSAYGFRDTGFFAVHAATGDDLMPELVDVINDEFDAVAANGVSALELARAKAQLKAGMMMGLESSMVRAEQMARQLMTHGRILPSDETIARVEAVDAGAVQAFAAGLMQAKRSIAVVGSGVRSLELAQRAARVDA